MKKLILLCCILLVGCQNNVAIDEINVTLPDENTVIVELEEETEEATQVEETTEINEETDLEETVDVEEAVDVEDTTEINEDVVENEELEMTKEDVLWLQESLKISGHYASLDGSYGPGTEKSLHDFQSEAGLDIGDFNTPTKTALEEIRKEKLAPGIGKDMILLNKHYYLPASFVPDGLREVNVDKNKYMELPDHVALQVEKMFEDAKTDGINIVLASAYRSYDYQEGIFSRRVARNGFEEAETVVAIPGESEHQTGLAIDITTANMNFGLSQTFDEDEAFDWMMENAYKYGFILRYLKGRESETGYVYEPWHYRYLGDVEACKFIMDNGLILEEYLNE